MMSELFSKADVAAWIEGFIQRFQTVRKRAGLSAAELSAMVGKAGHETVARIERGEGKMIGLPLLAVLVRLAVNNGLNAEWLVTGDGPMLASEGGVPLFRASHEELLGRLREVTRTGAELAGREQVTELAELLREVRGLRDEIDAVRETETTRLRQAVLAEVKALRERLREFQEAEPPGRRRKGRVKKREKT